MASIQTYNFSDHINNTTFPGVAFSVVLNSVALDLTDASIEMIIKRNDSIPVLTLSTAAETIIITDAINGIFQVKEQIISLPFNGLYSYDMIITFPSGKIKEYIQGTWQING